MFRDCLGNRVEVEGGCNEFEDGGEDVTLYIVHHKNDRRCPSDPTSITLPKGMLLDLILVHINRGREALNKFVTEVTPHLFVSNVGKPFTDTTFVHYWDWVMRGASEYGVPRFSPSFGRTIFIESYVQDADPDLWDGAALVMGNTVKQWDASYQPSKRRRMVNMAISRHAEYGRACDLKAVHRPP